MAADLTRVSSATVTLSADTDYVLNLTGAGSYVDLIGHGHGTRHDIWFAVAGSEAGLPAALTGGADGERLIHTDERVRVPAPRRDCWIKFRASGAYSFTAELVTTSF